MLGAFAAGVWGFWPILSEDFARNEPWRGAASLVGEACALAGLLAFAWRHGVRAVPLERGANRRRGAFLAGAAALCGGLLGDLAVTGSTLLEERSGHARSVPALADCVVTRTGGIGRTNYFRFRATWPDAAGRPRDGLLDTVFRELPSKNHPAGFEPRLRAAPGSPPPELILRAAAANGAGAGVRFRTRIRYDPRRPARCWVAGESWERDNAAVACRPFDVSTCRAAVTGVSAAPAGPRTPRRPRTPAGRPTPPGPQTGHG